jgi:hypothetical protein
MTSTDFGLTYGAENLLAGTATLNANCYDARRYTLTSDEGVDVVYYSDDGGLNPQMQFTTSSVMAPTTFITPEIIGDFTAECSGPGSKPSVTSMGTDKGAVWVQTDGTSSTYFDFRSAIVGIQEADAPSMNVFPNPATAVVQVGFPGAVRERTIMISDCTGRIVKTLSVSGNRVSVDLSAFRSGIYFISDGEGTTTRVTRL